MKKLKFTFTLLAAVITTVAFSQTNNATTNDAVQKGKLKITDASISVGGIFQNSPINTLSNFQKLAPQSLLLTTNFSGYSSSTGMASVAGPAFNANVGINRLKAENPTNKSVTQVRVGLSFSGTNISNYLSKTEKVPYDTLTSSQSGQTVYLDSVKTHSYSMNYKSQEIRLDVSLIYRTNPTARWSVYGGVGVEVGTTVSSYTSIYYNENNSSKLMHNMGSSSNYGGSSTTNGVEEHFINKNGFGYAAYLPVGLDFRVGKKKEFFKQTHLFCEVRPFLNYTNIPELGTFGGVGMRSSLGLRVTI
jgi:hypothetical protein